MNQINNIRSVKLGSGFSTAPPRFSRRLPNASDLDGHIYDLRRSLDALTQLRTELKGESYPNSQDFDKVFTRLRTNIESLGEAGGFKKPLRTPRLCISDAYHVASAANPGYLSPQAREFSAYQLAFRRSMTPWMQELADCKRYGIDLGINDKTSRYVFYGLDPILREQLMTPITKEEVDEAERFFKTAREGLPFPFDRTLWDNIIKEYNGVIPIKVEALPEGAVSFPGEPALQITTAPGYGGLGAWFESKLIQAWASTERATLMRYWLEYNKKLAEKCWDINQPRTDQALLYKAQGMLADYSDRSSVNSDESTRLGMASLLSFPITSTVSAAYWANQSSKTPPSVRLSFDSLYHGVVQGYPTEHETYGALFKHMQDYAKRMMDQERLNLPKYASYVADCYNFKKAVNNYLIPLAKLADVMKNGTIIFARPDSGDTLENILHVLDTAKDAGLYKEFWAPAGKDGKLVKLKAMTTLRVIMADGMTFNKIDYTSKESREKTQKHSIAWINNELIKRGYSPSDCIVYGVGGYLHDSLSRSNVSAALKLNAVGKDHRAVMKSPIDEVGKESVPGLIKIVRSQSPASDTIRQLGEPGQNVLVTRYDGTQSHVVVSNQFNVAPAIEPFNRVQQRTLHQFYAYSRPAVLDSPKTTQLRQQLRQQYQNAPIPDVDGWMAGIRQDLQRNGIFSSQTPNQ